MDQLAVLSTGFSKIINTGKSLAKFLGFAYDLSEGFSTSAADPTAGRLLNPVGKSIYMTRRILHNLENSGNPETVVNPSPEPMKEALLNSQIINPPNYDIPTNRITPLINRSKKVSKFKYKTK